MFVINAKPATMPDDCSTMNNELYMKTIVKIYVYVRSHVLYMADDSDLDLAIAPQNAYRDLFFAQPNTIDKRAFVCVFVYDVKI